MSVSLEELSALSAKVGRKIRARRKNLGFTVEKLSAMAGITDRFLHDIETGTKNMSLKTFYKLTDALGVSANWLLTDDDDGEEDENDN